MVRKKDLERKKTALVIACYMRVVSSESRSTGLFPTESVGQPMLLANETVTRDTLFPEPLCNSSERLATANLRSSFQIGVQVVF